MEGGSQFPQTSVTYHFTMVLYPEDYLELSPESCLIMAYVLLPQSDISDILCHLELQFLH
jgi:hypothetical protein